VLKIAWSPVYHHPLPPNHRFPMEKYSLLPQQLIYEGTITHENIFSPEPLDEAYILNTHSPAYWDKLKNLKLSVREQRMTGFPLTQGLVDREITIAKGTVDIAMAALDSGIGMNIAGGTHHAFTDRGEGFCLLNDVAIAANYLVEYHSLKKIAVVDLDVHQGNGTAQIFRANDNIFTFSMHGANNYPMFKEHSDLDISLPDGTGDKKYLRILNDNLEKTLSVFQPDFVFYQAGVDVLSTDKLGKLNLSIAGCKERDRLVFNVCKQMDIPVAVSMGGGYSKELKYIIEAHANTFRLAQNIFF